MPSILEPEELKVLASTVKLYDAICECGKHTVSLDEPICCQRCGSHRFSTQTVRTNCQQA